MYKAADYRNNASILIVEDDLVSANLLAGILQKSGYDISVASRIGEAEDILAKQDFSLILLDIHLPDGNGMDLCRKVAGNNGFYSTPVLFVSASEDLSSKIEGFEAGGVDYITKPFDGAEVLARVRTHLRLNRAYESLAALQTERIQSLSNTQMSMMPSPEQMPEARFQACLRQIMQAGGDFYDVIPSGNKITDYIVADASGHDLGVSIWTAAFKTLLMEYASVIHHPGEICRMINYSMQKVLPESMFFTAIYARLNRLSGTVSLVNAGHPSAIHYSASKQIASYCLQEGDVLGVFDNVGFGVTDISVQPGDRLFLFTDGLTEHNSHHDSSMAELLKTCQSTSNLPLEDAVPAIVDRIFTDNQMEDDIVLLGIEV